MTREEWRKHRTLDCIDQVMDCVQFMLYDGMDTHMCGKDLKRLHGLLALLQGEIINQIRDLEEENAAT